MATRLLSIQRGKGYASITEAAGSAVTTYAIELTVDVAQSVKRNELLRALDEFKKYIKKSPAFPLS